MPIVTDVPQSSPSRSALPACFGVVAALSGTLFAQSAVSIPQDTPFFKDPGGTRLGTLIAGARVASGRATEGFTQVTLDGWIFTASTQSDGREGFDLSVKITEGENLRTAPNGALIARAVEGTLFNRVSASGGWTRVRRTVWIASQSVRRPVARAPAARPETTVTRSSSDTGKTVAPPPPERRATLRGEATLQRSPDGPSLARLDAPAEVTVGESQGQWVKVTLQGWVRRSEVDSAVVPRPAITAAMLRDSPERFVGQTVDWRVQFLAMQRADELRPEMPAGQPYLLVRGPLPETGFAYVMVSRAQADALQGLTPLEELSLTVIVRAGRTRFLATPVVELVRRNP
jgi:hypothetical protein